MEPVNAEALASEALRLGLVTEAQLQEAWLELGSREGDLAPLLRFLEGKRYLTPWQSSRLLKGETEGYFLGGYKLLYKIASGSFGRVFRAEDPHTGRVVALKVLRRRWTENPHTVELFEREGRVGLSLQHASIVEILTVNCDKATGQYYIVMEFVEGGNLRDLLAMRKKFEPADALKITEEAASALAYAWSKGVTHRDMKLTNILISAQQAIAKLVDFGLANIYAQHGRDLGWENKDEKVDRTVDYAGLEKATGVASGDVRSDIYFLGCVLYELLTGRPPLEMTRSIQLRMSRHRFAAVKPMGRDEVNAPNSVFHLVGTMMELDPKLRYQTPAQLVDAIKACRRDVGEKAKSSGPNGQPGQPRTIFIVESDDRLQGPIREKFKELGYKVFLAADPRRALDRFRQQPFDALLMDAGTTGEDGLLVFDQVIIEAKRLGMDCAGILILSEGQADWAERIKPRPRVSIMVRPGVTLKQVHQKLQELISLKT
jgi:serine/threonine protein kinase